jgi:glutamyl-tRNA synthetase
VASGALRTDPVVGRLAPTPSGQLHLGNILAFSAAWLSVRSQNGRLLLRVEDIDTTRSRDPIASDQRSDLDWLGLGWDEEVPRQSRRDYDWALKALSPHSYLCQCTRAALVNTGGVYPGTCRLAVHEEGATRFQLPEGLVSFEDRQFGAKVVNPSVFGDPVLRRRDGILSYNLAVVSDDITDGVTEVVRGADLLEYTGVQLRLYEALAASPPTWLHSPLILGPDGKKLSKSHGAHHIGQLRDAGHKPGDIWSVVLPWLGLDPVRTLDEALPQFAAGRAVASPLLLDSPTGLP